MTFSGKIYTLKQALEKAQSFCAYQERCHKEVRTKLYSWGVRGEDVEFVLADLIENNFLNEERFARAYTRGKFKIKRWGKHRIQKELEVRSISSFCIELALSEEIDADDYLKSLEEVLINKWKSLKFDKGFQTINKVVAYTVSRGYESNLVWDTIKEIKSNGKY